MSEIYYPPVFGLSLNDTSTFPEYARYFYNFGMAMAITLAGIVIVFGGIYYLVSLGRGKFTDEGKAWVKAGVTGLILLLSSYLIVYTINPDLVIFRLNGLLPVIYTGSLDERPDPNAPRENYLEIPIGILTENVLTKTADCYTFDGNGDPVAFFIETKRRNPVFGPSKIDHDRADCILELARAGEKKTKAIKELSDQIVGLMEQCRCDGKCDSACDSSEDPETGQARGCTPPVDGECLGGPCKDGDCKAPQNSSGECCPENTKNQIEEMLDQLRTQRSNIAKLVEQEIQTDKKNFLVINIDGKQGVQTQEIWKDLKLIEQLMYFKEKIELMKQKIKKGLNELSSAKNALNQCYYAMPYIDFLKLWNQTRPEEKIIQRNQVYTDPETKKEIDPAKYCSGFSFGNSNCFNICKNVCPGDSRQDLACYKGCRKCIPEDFNNEADYQSCLNDQRPCMEKCYNQRKCLQNDNYTNFEGCLSYCRGECEDLCESQFSDKPDDLADCHKKCRDNSKCLTENESKCVFSPQKLRQCAENITNDYYLKNCLEVSVLCKFGSSQNSGYPECLKAPFSTKGDYSASFIFQNQEHQVCGEPYSPYKPEADIACVDIYPETNKCPASSNCPDCPCGTDEKSSEYNIVDGKCDEFLYNDDPLTFYCKQNWWEDEKGKEPEPIGNERFCSKANEIPLGRTVDGTENWAQSLMKKIDEVSKQIKEMAGYLKKIGQEENYCRCDSACEGGKPCSTDCKFSEETETTDSEGNEITLPERCVFQPCQGISCQKMVNLLKGGATENCPVEKEGVESFYKKISEATEELRKFTITGGRSDLLKGLTYSRTKTNECSLIKNINGEEAILLNCQRATDEVVPPIVSGEVIVNDKIIKSQCYGHDLWKFGQKNLSDNWFCCEKR